MSWSFKIGSNEFLVKRWPKPKITWAIGYATSWAENQHGSDRGAAQDIYETEVTFYETEDGINAIQTALETVREAATLSDFTDEIFAPNVDHTGSIACVLSLMKPRRATAFDAAGGGLVMFEMTVLITAISPTILGTTPSLFTLRPQYGYEADRVYESLKGFTYDRAPIYADRRTDAGLFTGPFLQTTAELKAILRYILVTARATVIEFPAATGIEYPFGILRGTHPLDCKITAFSFSRRDFEMWNLSMTFAEHN